MSRRIPRWLNFRPTDYFNSLDFYLKISRVFLPIKFSRIHIRISRFYIESLGIFGSLRRFFGILWITNQFLMSDENAYYDTVSVFYRLGSRDNDFSFGLEGLNLFHYL